MLDKSEPTPDKPRVSRSGQPDGVTVPRDRVSQTPFRPDRSEECRVDHSLMICTINFRSLGRLSRSMKMICCHVPSSHPATGKRHRETRDRAALPAYMSVRCHHPTSDCAHTLGILRRNPLKHTFEIGDQNGFVLDRCHRTCRAGRKYRGGDIPVRRGEAA
jgi:hypothetical protein